VDSNHSVNLDFGLIVPDSPEAVELGFSSVKFCGDLRLVNGTIYMWRILSKEPGKGRLSGLIQRMLDCGYTVKIPTPIGRMAEIVRRKGFTRTVEYDPELEPYEVWVKEPLPVFTNGSLAPGVLARPYEAAFADM